MVRMKIMVALWYAAVASAGAEGIPVLVDISKAPGVEVFAQKSKALCEEWYPRINEILFGAAHPLPFNEIQIVFERKLAMEGAPAYTDGSAIHVWSDYIKTMPDDFRAMMIHELTHVNQHYPSIQKDSAWVVEGIADYVRHKYFEKDIEATLHVDANGRLKGYSVKEPYFYGLERKKVNLDPKGYLKTYTVASTFLFWLESRKDKEIVRRLNVALSEGRYSSKLFQQYCGQPLDTLWREFMTESKRTLPANQ
jgi:hypothetical protein